MQRARGTHLDDLECRSTARSSTSLDLLFTEASLDRGQSIVRGDGARAEFHGDLTGNTIDVPTGDTAALVRAGGGRRTGDPLANGWGGVQHSACF
jgi:hypothetical protein